MTSPHPQVQAWAARLGAKPVPVLAESREALARCRQQGDRVDANALAQVVLRDPLLALRVLVHTQQRLGARLSRPVETVTAALVLLGIEPFFTAFDNVETVEDRLADQPQAMAGLQACLNLASRAARIAAAIAVHRQDTDAELLYETALLDGFAELLLWIEAPAEAAAIAERRQSHPTTPADAERAVLGTELHAIGAALMQQWGLPSLLRELAQPGLPAHPGARTVALARRLAQEASASPEILNDLARLLNVSVPAAQALVAAAHEEG